MDGRDFIFEHIRGQRDERGDYRAKDRVLASELTIIVFHQLAEDKQHRAAPTVLRSCLGHLERLTGEARQGVPAGALPQSLE